FDRGCDHGDRAPAWAGRGGRVGRQRTHRRDPAFAGRRLWPGLRDPPPRTRPLPAKPVERALRANSPGAGTGNGEQGTVVSRKASVVVLCNGQGEAAE